MTLGMFGAQRQVPIEYVFVEGLDALPKLVKTGERVVWFDYGTNLDQDSIPRVFNTMEKDIRVVVFPSVVEGVDWDMFRKKTVEGSTEPVHAGQRRLAHNARMRFAPRCDWKNGPRLPSAGARRAVCG